MNLFEYLKGCVYILMGRLPVCIWCKLRSANHNMYFESRKAAWAYWNQQYYTCQIIDLAEGLTEKNRREIRDYFKTLVELDECKTTKSPSQSIH